MTHPLDFHIRHSLEFLKAIRQTPEEMRAFLKAEAMRRHRCQVLACRAERRGGTVERFERMQDDIARLKLNQHCNQLDYEIAAKHDARIAKLEAKAATP